MSKRKDHPLFNNSRSGRGGSARSSNVGYRLTGAYHNADQKRDVWAGYPSQVDFDMHWNMVSRNGIAKAGIHRIVDKCWQDNPIITDGEYDGKRPLTEFEQDLAVLVDDHHLYTRLKGLDWRQRVGRYAGLLPIVKEPGQSTPNTKPRKVVSVSALLKLVPVFESQIDVTDVGTQTSLDSANYGMPKHYNYRENVAGDRNPINNNEFELNVDRVFVFAEGADDGSIYGEPANEAGYNDLLDLEKVRASAAEGLFKNSKQRTVINVKDSQVANVLATDDKKREKWENAADDFASGFDTMLTTYGMDVSTLNSTLADPTNPFTIALQGYCASIQIPTTILIGQQTGRLASDEDQSDWAQTASSRCVNTLTPMIKSLLKYFIERGIIRKPSNEMLIEWQDFTEPNLSTKLDSGKKMAEINKQAFDSGRGEPVFSNEEIRKTSGFDEEVTGELEEFGEDDDLDDDLNEDT